jgi:preprotein translocase subunit YajC
MAVDYLGIHIDSLTYISILLFGLIVFVAIWIISEIKRKKRHKRALNKLKKAELKIIS